MVGSLRRTTSVPGSGGEDSLTSRRRNATETVSELNDAKAKNEPLPDILSDWEIIVKSLRGDTQEVTETQNTKDIKLNKLAESQNKNTKETKSSKLVESQNKNTKVIKSNKLSKSTKNFTKRTGHSHPSSLKAKKNQARSVKVSLLQKRKKLADSKFRKRKLRLPEPRKSLDRPTPSTSSYLFSPVKKLPKNQLADDDSETNWRRPTRSTYKAFETIFDSSELEDLPLKCELNGGDPKEVEALKAILTPKKALKLPSFVLSERKERKRHLKRLFPTKKINKGNFRTNAANNTRPRGRPRKINISDNFKEKLKKRIKETGGYKARRKHLRERRNLKDRRITRSLFIKNKLENEGVINNSKSTCKKLIVKVENLKFPSVEKMDFLGFDSFPPSPTERKLMKTPDFSEEPHKEIIAQESLELTSDEEADNDLEVKPLNFIETTNETSPVRLLARSPSPMSASESSLEVKPEFFFDNATQLEFELHFGCEKEEGHNDFEGFTSSYADKKTCLKCFVVLDDPDALKHHVKVGHKKVYLCPFDTGNCTRSKGAVGFHNHLVECHSELIDILMEDLDSDRESGKLTLMHSDDVSFNFCCICLMPLEQQSLKCIHEILVHGIWPPSLLNLSPIAIDQHVSLWWTGRSLAFACHLCYSPEDPSIVIPIISCSPHSFPKLLANHVCNVHFHNISFIQCWYLSIKLILSLNAFARRTMATMISFGVSSTLNYAKCLLCQKVIRSLATIDLSQPGSLCKKCDLLCKGGKHCWFGCATYNSKLALIEHFVISHQSENLNGWCITCGSWSNKLMFHMQTCSYNKPVCKLCGTKTDVTTLKKVLHSLSAHSYFCPIPSCCESCENTPKCFPSTMSLFSHIVTEHLPECNKFGLEQIASLIFSCKKNNLFVLTSTSAQQLNGTWVGVSGHYYRLQGIALSPKETVEVSLICILCTRQWSEVLTDTCKDNGAVCPECKLALSGIEQKITPKQCPIFSCSENIHSLDELCQHLKDDHKMVPLPKKNNCSYCGPISLASTLTTVTHNTLSHKMACLLCPFAAPTSAQIFAHRATMHGLPSWEAVFYHLKMEEKSKQMTKDKPQLFDGLIRVWDDDQGTCSMWDQTLKCAELLTCQNGDDKDFSGGIINQSFQEKDGFQKETVVDQWCSSICSVSMSSPSKFNIADFNSSDIDTKPKNSDFAIDADRSMENVSPHLLVPSVSVGDSKNGDSDSSAGSDVALEIDSDAESTSSKLEIVTSNKNEELQSKSSSNKKPQKLLNSDFAALNNVMKESLNSMNHVLPSVGDSKSKPLVNSHSKQKKVDVGKGLAENACFDEKSMGENILKDLEEKYCATCIDCGNSVQLSHLQVHMKSMHPGKLVHCTCTYKAELYDALVHTFHMSHMPNEARPIIFKSPDDDHESMIVLEARSDLKSMTYPCYKCFKRFKQEKSRQLHYNLCKLEKKFNCDVCGEKFALDNHLQKHKEWKHNPQICKHCNKTFTSSSSLAQHVLHIHKKPLSHSCKQCGDAFNTPNQLKVHLRIHSGEQPHACKYCTSRFISRNLLRKHLLKNHKQIAKAEGLIGPKVNGGVSSSSSDSSDSDDSESDAKKFAETKSKDKIVIALTESDLDTSSSDIEELSPPQKKLKTSIPTPPIKKLVLKKSPTPQKEISDSNLSIKNTKAGIYQDQGVMALPEVRPNIRNRVKSTVDKVCVPCSQEFESATAKLLHMYLIHPGVVLTMGFNECCFCNHKFTSADDVSNHHLDKHQRTALPNGSFRCLCGLVFREDGAYYFHLYYAHKAQRALNIGGEIVCRVCERRPKLNKIVDLVVHLSDRHTMFDHVRFNDSYMCNFCYKAFESWTVLSLHFFMVHKATKSQTLSYDCPFCQGASPWHSLEALQYHLENVHRGRHTQSRPVPKHSRSIYTPAPIPSSPTKSRNLRETLREPIAMPMV